MKTSALVVMSAFLMSAADWNRPRDIRIIGGMFS